jgi:cyanophycinase
LGGGENMKGNLVIAGGNISSNMIYETFVELAGGNNAKIAIVPTAASDTEAAFHRYSEIFQGCGVKSEEIICIKVDPDKEPTDGWRNSGDDFESNAFLNNITGVWFVGGDQIKIIRGFLTTNGYETKILAKFKEILNQGGVIGGSSAGAAIMSEVIIGGGTSAGALGTTIYKDFNFYRSKPELEEKGKLLITKGLGFFKDVIIDQHFDKRRRMGRLVKALFEEKISRGYGVAEDTAMIYNIEKDLVTVIGTGRVAIINISFKHKINVGKYKNLLNIKLWFLKNNDCYSNK